MMLKFVAIALLVTISYTQSQDVGRKQPPQFAAADLNAFRSLLPISRNVNCPKCSCGIPNSETRIIGGKETQPNQYPWIAQLVYNETYFYCGASLINNNYLLTAAHCTRGIDQSKVHIRLLSHSRVRVSADAIIRKPAKVTEHPEYEPSTYNHDIALVKLDKPVEFSHNLRPVCLPKSTETYAGRKGISMGWGAISENGNLATELLEVTLPVITNKECMDLDFEITDNMMCAGGEPGVEKDSCQGDSGGPFILKEGNKFEQIGIVSWGDGCGEMEVPGVYTRVTNYYNWIKSNTRDACYCS